MQRLPSTAGITEHIGSQVPDPKFKGGVGFLVKGQDVSRLVSSVVTLGSCVEIETIETRVTREISTTCIFVEEQRPLNPHSLNPQPQPCSAHPRTQAQAF